MSGMMTQEEHKAALAAEELAAQEQDPQSELEQSEPKAIEENAPEPDGNAEPESDDTPVIEQESWMQSEADDSQGDDLTAVPNAVWAAVRKGAKAKAERVDEAHQTELAKMQAQIDQLSTNVAQAPAKVGRPQRADFYDTENPDDDYDDAMYVWRTDQDAKRNQGKQQEQQAKDFAANQDRALNDHYSRAESLSKQGISAEHYQHSDLTVRNLLGNDLTNSLISSVGEGSEKIFYSLGRNPSKLAELKQAMDSDPSGLKAMLMLGKMSNGLSAQTKRKSLAPAPAATADGGQGGQSSKGVKSAYTKAVNSGDSSKAFNLKRAARKAGTDTSNW